MNARPSPWPAPSALDLEDLLDELRARASAARASQERLAALLDAVVAVSADLELSDVLGRIVEAACRLVDARYGALGVISEDGEELTAFITHGVSDEERAAIGDPPHGRGVLGLLIREPKTQRLPEVGAHPDSVGFPPNHPEMHSFLGTPIRIRDRVFGNLYLAEKRGAPEFSDEDESMLVALAAAAGVAIENAQLYERSERQRQWSEAISELTRMLLESEDEDSALERMIAHARQFAAADVAAVALTDDVGELVVRAVHTARDGHEEAEPGSTGGQSASPRVTPPGALEVGKVLEGPRWQAVREARQPLLLLPESGDERAAASHGLAQSLTELNPHGPTAILPVVVGSGDLGVLVLGWQGEVPGSAGETMTAVADFAQQAALALVAGRAQRDRSRMALLEDRERIARDMHDHVIQRLFATGLSLQSAARLAQHPLVRARLEDAVDELDESIRHIRHTIFELHRPIPTGGLRAELHSLVDDITQSLGFPPRLSIEGSLGGLADGLEADIVAVVREGLSNIARHAHASKASVDITAGDRICIVVTDDGVGADPGLARSGLVNLGSRAAARSGTFDVRRGEPRGTVLSWEVPRETRG
ncbi:MAG TPA: GAF domain-containing sensor histidine kinase [Segeticoccus sp.]|uniref:GAF domain-containing sensor histidine kinase n=1 Tax=Segeticoccus sp. TaxID=2706531 RepID=UPI002D7E93FD|nr:GAF domain-containing sensor histidine kinase [Segeticoccus sp.]HET8601485.1 GAF domain-containing sensor histidine kinase [Segeticoccus sp.]